MKDAISKRLIVLDPLMYFMVLVTMGFALGFSSSAIAQELSPSIVLVDYTTRTQQNAIDDILDSLLVTDSLTPKAIPPPRSGRKRQLPAPAPSAAWKATYGNAVMEAARTNNLPANLIMAVIAVESGYNSKARNGTSAGLMQIKLSTARICGLSPKHDMRSLYDPVINIRVATNCLGIAHKLSHGNICSTVSRYNRGLYSRGISKDYCAKVARIMRYPEFHIE